MSSVIVTGAMTILTVKSVQLSSQVQSANGTNLASNKHEERNHLLFTMQL